MGSRCICTSAAGVHLGQRCMYSNTGRQVQKQTLQLYHKGVMPSHAGCYVTILTCNAITARPGEYESTDRMQYSLYCTSDWRRFLPDSLTNYCNCPMRYTTIRIK